MEIISRNFVAVFDVLVNNSLVNIYEIMGIVSGESPQVVKTGSDFGAFWMVSFPRTKLQVVGAERRVQIVVDAPEDADVTRQFSNICISVMHAVGDQMLAAYGFNYMFSFKDTRHIADVVGTHQPLRALTPFEFVDLSQAHLSYRYENAIYGVTLTRSVADRIEVAVNVHYEDRRRTTELGQIIPSVYPQNAEVSKRLVEGIINAK